MLEKMSYHELLKLSEPEYGIWLLKVYLLAWGSIKIWVTKMPGRDLFCWEHQWFRRSRVTNLPTKWVAISKAGNFSATSFICFVAVPFPLPSSFSPFHNLGSFFVATFAAGFCFFYLQGELSRLYNSSLPESQSPGSELRSSRLFPRRDEATPDKLINNAVFLYFPFV